MSKKERLQARLDYLKALIIAFLVALFGIFGYTATHYKEIDLVLGICIAIGIIVLLCGIYVAKKHLIKDLMIWRNYNDWYNSNGICAMCDNLIANIYISPFK